MYQLYYSRKFGFKKAEKRQNEIVTENLYLITIYNEIEDIKFDTEDRLIPLPVVQKLSELRIDDDEFAKRYVVLLSVTGELNGNSNILKIIKINSASYVEYDELAKNLNIHKAKEYIKNLADYKFFHENNNYDICKYYWGEGLFTLGFSKEFASILYKDLNIFQGKPYYRDSVFNKLAEIEETLKKIKVMKDNGMSVDGIVSYLQTNNKDE